jgi:hypothetical protein
MCEMCDQPGLDRDDWLDGLRTRLSEVPFLVQVVEGDRSYPLTAYSVGLTGHGLPELVVTGAPVDDSVRLVEV